MITPETAANMIGSLAGDLIVSIPPTLTELGVAAPKVAAVSNALQDVEAAAQALGQAEGAGSTLPLIQRIANDVAGVANAIGELPGIPVVAKMGISLGVMVMQSIVAMIEPGPTPPRLPAAA